jgi:dipeptidyl aminopeptidase/acylaminoacyl peptidase
MTRVPYGSWLSTLGAEQAVAGSLRLAEPRLDGDCSYWIEGRPHEGGRCVLVRRDAGGAGVDLLPAGYSARSRVHEYGGGAYAVDGGRVCFVNDADQCLHVLERAGPRRIQAPGPRRYADLAFDPARPRVLGVCEDHGGPGEPVTSLVAVDLRDGASQTLAGGADFYSAPRPSADGRRVAWIQWQHPNMPWDATELWVADLDDEGRARDARRVAGGSGESIQQPAWHADGTLYLLTDRNGWWNLHRWRGAEIAPVTRERAELAGAPWAFGASTYALIGRDALCALVRAGRRQLARVALDSGSLTPVATPLTEIEGLQARGGRVVCIGASPRRARAVFELDEPRASWRELRAASAVLLDEDEIAVAEPLAFATGEGETAYAWWYAPRNRACAAPAAERPPVVVRCHGGPTSCAGTALDLRTQFWTQRGFALLDVDYRGSSGYGRAYRERLYGQWGIIDVEDCVRATAHVADAGLADGGRAVVTGSSSGGYTVLCALAAQACFRAGASHYGIGDLELLIRDTHKFESRYTQRLVGEDPAVWRARSPLHRAGRIGCPVLFLQGLEDRVVPPAQSRHMVAALRARGVPVAYLEFPGEAHGFRRADTLRRALEAELDFHARVLRVTPAGPLAPVAIEPPLP